MRPVYVVYDTLCIKTEEAFQGMFITGDNGGHRSFCFDYMTDFVRIKNQTINYKDKCLVLRNN